MIRVIYRWKVEASAQAAFAAAWSKATLAIRASTTGARGSTLLRSYSDPAEFITIARWDSHEQWQVFWQGDGSTEMSAMHKLAQRLGVEVYEEIEDHTV